MFTSYSILKFRLVAFCTVVFVCGIGLLQAQNPHATPNPEQRLVDAQKAMDEGERLFGEGSKTSISQARIQFRKAQELFRLANNNQGLGLSYLYSGVSAGKIGDDPGALDDYAKSIILFRLIGDKESEAIAFNNIGLIHAQKDVFDEAFSAYMSSLTASRAARSVKMEILTLRNLGTLYENRGELRKALPVLKVAEDLFVGHPDQRQRAENLNQIGLILARLTEYGEAYAFLERGLRSALETGATVYEGIIRHNIGDIYFAQKETKKATPFFEQAIAIFEKAGEKERLAQSLTSLANTVRDADKGRALEFYHRSLAIYHESGDEPSEAIPLAGIVSIHVERGERVEALKYIERAAKIAEQLKLGPLVGTINERVGDLYRDVSDLPNALVFYKKTLEFYRIEKSPKDEARILVQLAVIYTSLSDFLRATSCLEAANVIFESLGDKKALQQNKALVGATYAIGGQYRKAINVYQDMLAEVSKEGDREGSAYLMALIGQAHGNIGEYQAAIENSKKSLEYFESTKTLLGEHTATITLGYVYGHLGLYDQATAHFEKAAVLGTQLGIPAYSAGAQSGLGSVSLNLEQPEKAIEHYEKALSVYRRAGMKSAEATVLNNLGYAYGLKKDFKQALKKYEESQVIYLAIDDKNGQAFSLLNLGYTYFELDESSKALPMLKEALQRSKTLGDRRLETYALGYLAEYWQKEKNNGLAIFYGKEAVNLVQSIRTTLISLDEQTQKAYIKQFEKGYRKFASLLIEEGRIAEAEIVIAMLKEEEFFDFLRRDGSASKDLLSKVSLTADEKKAYDEYMKYADGLTALGKELGELQLESKQFEIGKFPKQARLDELEKQITNANVVFLAFLDKLKLSFGANDSRVGVLESGSQALLKELNEPRTVFISTISGEEKLNIVVTTSDVQKAYTVPVKSTELNKLVADFRAVLRNPAFDPRPAGKAIYDKVFPAGLLKDLEGVKADTIVWSLDGTLRYIPISALWDGEKYLVERFNNVIITLASRDKIVAKSAERSKWNALGVGVSKKIDVTESDGKVRTFDALNAVPEELCSIVSDPTGKTVCSTTAGAMSGKMLLDEAFTLKNFKDSLGRFPVVHIASHFSLNAGNETDSYLLLGGGEDRRFTLASIRQSGTQFVGVDLLTLSACNTGMSAGNKSNGIEVEGFGVLAQRSGAKSVLASLWAVSDSSTRDLMINFYRNLDTDRASGKATALRNAQMSLLKGKSSPADGTPKRASDIIEFEGEAERKPFARDPNAPYAHPYYWSPFVLIGNWR